MTEINRYRVFLNSDQRTHGSNDYFQVVLNKPFVLEHENNFFMLQVDSASIPFSFKTINDRNHTITGCSATIDGVMHTFDLTVPNGNYSASEFIEIFRQVLYDQIFIKFAIIPIFRFTYNQPTGKFTLECLNTGSWSIWINARSSNLLGFLGFSRDFTFTNIWKAVSTQHVVMSPIKALFIRADSITLDNYEALLEPILKSDILCRIPITSGYNSWIQYTGSGHQNRLLDKTVNTISLYLSPDNSYFIDLDNIPWQVCLTFIEYQAPQKLTVSKPWTVSELPPSSSSNISDSQPLETIPEKTNLEIELEDYEKELALLQENMTQL